MYSYQRQRGAVSLFIVIFSALLITVVTVGFIRLMLADQQQATANDLSQSAYDSAQAGVEDAKRAILRYQNVCSTGSLNDCQDAYNAISSTTCNQGLSSIVDTTKTEVFVQQTQGDQALNQAYTCVKIIPETDDYVGSLTANASKLIPLKSKSIISSVMIQWYDRTNITNANFSVDLLPITAISLPLFSQTYDTTTKGWGPSRPSIMRSQLMQFGSSFTLSDFDDSNSSAQSNANTLFLYPTGTSGKENSSIDQISFSQDIRKISNAGLTPVNCSGSLSGGGFACSVKIALPTPIGGGAQHAYLRLSSLYNASNYRVTLLSGASSAKFDAVQPEIDSTGRADNLFRRVVTRVEPIDTSFSYPDATIDITGNLCKNFSATTQPADYTNTCTP